MPSYKYVADSFKLIINESEIGDDTTIPSSTSRIDHLHFDKAKTLSFVIGKLKGYANKDKVKRIHIWGEEPCEVKQLEVEELFQLFAPYKSLVGLFIATIPLLKCTLPPHPTLKSLTITGCELNDAGSVLAGLRLKDIQLQNNDLSDISTECVGSEISIIDISQNKITSDVARKLLNHISSLTNIKLSRNSINTIRIGPGGPQLDAIEMLGNPVSLVSDANLIDTPLLTIKEIAIMLNGTDDATKFIGYLPRTQLVVVDIFHPSNNIFDFRIQMQRVIRYCSIIQIRVNGFNLVDQKRMKYIDALLRFLILNPDFPKDLIIGTNEIKGLV